MIHFLDFEASSLMKGSFPIEVAWVDQDAQAESYLIKPAPFCILDEVDAPLDDDNVGKFTNMIKQFSNNSQFIIVTHNKTTMSTVDVIYGVTMQEPGVSKLVPVDFRNLN